MGKRLGFIHQDLERYHGFVSKGHCAHTSTLQRIHVVTHMSRKCHMIYAQPHLRSMHEYEAKEGGGRTCSAVYSMYGQWEVAGTRY